MPNQFYKPEEEKKFYKPRIGEKISETDTRVKIIDPQLRQSGWKEEDIKREFYFKKGKIIIEGNEAKRGERKFADYVLFFKNAFPIAVIEAKRYFKHHAAGIFSLYSKNLGPIFSTFFSGKWTNNELTLICLALE